MKNVFAPILIAVFLLLPTAALAINVTPDVVFSGNDVFQSTTVNVPIPSGITAGMVLFIAITFADNQTGTVSITGDTSSTAWTSFGTVGGTPTKYAFYKVADAGDAADSAAGGRSWTLNCSDGFIEQWAGAAWSGVNTSNPFATGPSINNGVATTFSFSSQTSPGSSAVWVGLAMIENNSTSVTDPSSPVVNQEQSTSAYYFGPGIVYSATGITGAFAPTGTIGNGFEWGTIAFFLNPAGGGGGATGRIIRLIGGTRLIGGIRLGGSSPCSTCAYGFTNIASGNCREFITTTGAGTFTVPSNWNSSNNTIEVIGGGGGGDGDGSGGTQAAGGGGGAYAIKNNLVLTHGASITVGLGAGGPGGIGGGNPGTDGGDTFFNRTAGGSNTCADTTSVCAKGGSGGVGPTGGAGGLGSGSTGDTTEDGGTGGTVSNNSWPGGGGGGAAGPNGVGQSGGGETSNSGTTTGGAGGGGNGGGTAGTSVTASGTINGTAGGNNAPASGSTGGGGGGTGGVSGASGTNGTNGTAGGGGGGGGGTDQSGSFSNGGNGGNGGTGTEWGSSYGSGGGGGGGGSASSCCSMAGLDGIGGNGGLYGGGGGGGGSGGNGGGANGAGGNGAQGIIVITYHP